MVEYINTNSKVPEVVNFDANVYRARRLMRHSFFFEVVEDCGSESFGSYV